MTKFGISQGQSVALKTDKRDKVNLVPLQAKLETASTQAYGVILNMLNQSLCAILTYNTQATFTGRIHMIASFLPFSDTETAVVLHKFFLDYQDRLHLDLDLSPDIHRYLAHIDLEAVDDGSMFSKLAKKHHNPQLSARSLDKAMERKKVKLTNEYKDTHELVSEDTNKRPLEKYRLKFLPNLDDIVVHKIEEEEDGKEKERLHRRS
jgi:hypothetical protein